jgi:hypothetical protein
METSSLSADECNEILHWSRKKLSLMKWSNLEPSDLPIAAEELGNPFPKQAVAPTV